MASVNMAVVVGFVGSDPRVATTRNGMKTAGFSVATTEKGYTAQNGTVYPDRTEWHNIVCWGRLADIVERFVKKGSSVYVQGKMRSRTYEKDGQTRYAFEIECETLQLLDRQSEVSQNSGQQPVQTWTPSQQPMPQNNEIDTPF